MLNSDRRREPGVPSGRAKLLLVVTLLWMIVPILNLSAAQRVQNRIDLIPRITSLDIQGGRLIASGFSVAMVNGTTQAVPFSTAVDISLADNQQGKVCPI